MKIEIRMEGEWGTRQLRLKSDCYMGKYIFRNNNYFERDDFTSPKLIRVKIRRK